MPAMPRSRRGSLRGAPAPVSTAVVIGECPLSFAIRRDGGGAGGYVTPVSGVDFGGAVEGGAGDGLLAEQHDAFPAEWTAAFLEDISGYDMLGLSDVF